MNRTHAFRWLLSSIICLILGKTAFCDGTSCTEVAAMARMARAGSAEALAQQERAAGNGYTARVVSAYRLFELHPKDMDAAKRLLDLIPKDEKQDSVREALSTFLCDSESLSDVKTLARVGDDLPHQFARAVLLYRGAMPAYVAYSQTAILDPHNDHTVQMKRVCRDAHPEFVQAVGRLAHDDYEWFVVHIFDPKTCRPLWLPEAD